MNRQYLWKDTEQAVLQIIPHGGHVPRGRLLFCIHNLSGCSETNYAQYILCSSSPACFLQLPTHIRVSPWVTDVGAVISCTKNIYTARYS